MPAAHPPEFRQRAIELDRTSDKSVGQVAKPDLGRPVLATAEPCNYLTDFRRGTLGPRSYSEPLRMFSDSLGGPTVTGADEAGCAFSRRRRCCLGGADLEIDCGRS